MSATMRGRLDPYLGLVAFGLLGALPSRAAAEDDLERAARKACLSGDYQKGVDLLSDLFLDTRDPTHIFNQGRCFQQNNRFEEAVGRFREYLRKATAITPQERADTERYIEECQKLLRGSPVQGSSAVAPTDSPPPPPPMAPPPPPVPAAGTAVASNDTGKGLRIAGVAVGIAGLASVGAGIYYYSRARDMSDKVSNSDQPTWSDQQAGKNAETMQWIFYGVGGAAVASGTVLYLVGNSASRRGQVAKVAPILGPNLVGLAAQGVF
jgi:hypothetical protein